MVMKVLIIDDEQLVRWFLERALKRWNFEVLSVSNVQDAMKHLESTHFDMVFTDLKMPAGNGALVIEKVDKMTNPPKLVVCSAYITPDMEETFRENGITTLKKPFKLDELERTLKKILTV